MKSVYCAVRTGSLNKTVRFVFKGLKHVWGTREVQTGFWWGDVREGNDWEDLGIDGRTVSKWICREWTGLIWLRRGTGGGRF